ARQGQLQVQVWAPTDPTRAFDGARHRFGAAASIRMVRDPQGALAFAAEGKGVAVLAVNTDDSWWLGLRRDWSSLSVFDGFGAAGRLGGRGCGLAWWGPRRSRAGRRCVCCALGAWGGARRGPVCDWVHVPSDVCAECASEGVRGGSCCLGCWGLGTAHRSKPQ